MSCDDKIALAFALGIFSLPVYVLAHDDLAKAIRAALAPRDSGKGNT